MLLCSKGWFESKTLYARVPSLLQMCIVLWHLITASFLGWTNMFLNPLVGETKQTGFFKTFPWKTLRLCDTCLASTGKGTPSEMHGRNYSTLAAWRLTRLTHEGYIDHECGNLSPYMAVQGYRHETVVYDWLHNVYLGVGRDLFASGLKMLIMKGVWEHVGNDWNSVLAAVHMEMHRSCANDGFLNLFFMCMSFS